VYTASQWIFIDFKPFSLTKSQQKLSIRTKCPQKQAIKTLSNIRKNRTTQSKPKNADHSKRMLFSCFFSLKYLTDFNEENCFSEEKLFFEKIALTSLAFTVTFRDITPIGIISIQPRLSPPNISFAVCTFQNKSVYIA